MFKDTEYDEFKLLLENEKQSLLQSIDQETKSLKAFPDPNSDLLDAVISSHSQEKSSGWLLTCWPVELKLRRT